MSGTGAENGPETIPESDEGDYEDGVPEIYWNLDGFDLRLMSWGDGSGVPTSGKNLVVVGLDNNRRLHIRILDAPGDRVIDRDEAQLPVQAAAIATLKWQLPRLLPPHVLSDAERAQVIARLTSIVGQIDLDFDADYYADPAELRKARGEFLAAIRRLAPQVLASLRDDVFLRRRQLSSHRYALELEGWGESHHLLAEGWRPAGDWIRSAARLTLREWEECPDRLEALEWASQATATPLSRRERLISAGFDLRLMSWGGTTGVPTSGSSLIIIGTDDSNLLHIRVFDASGNQVEDTDETRLRTFQAGAVATLKQQLPGLLPPHVLTEAEKARVIGEATPIVGQALSAVRGPEAGELLQLRVEPWDPPTEPRMAYESRVLAEVKAALAAERARIIAAAEERLMTPAPRKLSTDHFEWLVQYQVLGLSFNKIAKQSRRARSAVEEAVKGTAKLLIGVTWPEWLRPPQRGGRPPTRV
jgi:hypothetical protein